MSIIHINSIFAGVATATGVTVDEMVIPGRTTQVTIAKQAAIYLLKENTGMSLCQIAKLFDITPAGALFNYKAFQNDLLVNRARIANVLNLVETYKSNKL